MSSESWDAFFDAHYALTYAPLQPDDWSRAEALAATRLAGLSPGSRALDVPCGYGRHSVPLAAAGYRVLGLDRSAAQLAEARRRRGAASEPRLVRADYRQLPIATGTFDGAVTLLSSLGYAGEDDDRRALREIRRVLCAGGRLVIDTNHRDRQPHRSPWREWHRLGDGAVLLTERRVDWVAGMVEMTHTYVPTGGSFRPGAFAGGPIRPPSSSGCWPRRASRTSPVTGTSTGDRSDATRASSSWPPPR